MNPKIQNRIKWLEREIKRLKKVTDLSDLGKAFLTGRHERMVNEQDFLIELLEEEPC